MPDPQQTTVLAELEPARVAGANGQIPSASPASEAVDPDAFRRVMGSFASGITVVTTRLPDAQPIGITVTAFASLSLEPPLVLVNLARSLFTLKTIRRTGTFAVNILGAEQEWLARRFASSVPDKFAGVPHAEGRLRLPLLAGALACAECRLVEVIEAGDHAIVLGLVVAADAREGQPLLYFRRQFVSGTASGRSRE